MPDVRGAARAVLSHAGPLYRIASAWAHPVNEGARLRAAGRVLTHEVLTRGFGRPLVVPIGTHSKIIARRGETNSPHAVRGNPPNDEMHVWRAYLRPGDLFVDVGANIGIYTIFALDLGAEVIAVEPTPNADRVREHLELNGYAATVVQQALADRPGTVRMTEGLDSLNHLLLDGCGGVEVPATTLDEVLGDRTAAGVKIDVEGAERLVLEGAARAMSEARVRLLQLEWAPARAEHTLGEGRAALAELLRGHGYGLWLPDRTGHLHEIAGDVPAAKDVFAAAPGVLLPPELIRR